jgi:3-isopropylmalate/(R)-2-methylmalate dehydratase large subunit
VSFGYKPDQVKPVKEMEGLKVDQIYIGSCTNGRIEDLRVAARVLEGKKIHQQVRGIVSPATTEVFGRALAEGLLKTFMDAGFCVTNATCGACLGMSNGVLAEGEVCAATTNRNFNGRMGKGGMVHLMSPATAAATAVAGHITNSELYKKSG